MAGRNQRQRPPRPGLGDWLQCAASLCWLPQAGAIALALQRLAGDGGLDGVVAPAVVFLLFAVLRAALDALGARIAFRVARASLSRQRQAGLDAFAAQNPFDRERLSAGAAASLVAEQAEALLPAATRYGVARLRVIVVPLVMLLVLLPLSWAVVAVLVCAAPLIPLFMAVIGARAKSASEAHLGELGRLQGFLLDRLRGLATIRAYGAVERTAQRLDAASADLRRRVMGVLRIAFLSSAVLELFAALGVAMVAVYVGFHLLGELNLGAWGQRLSLGEAVFILLLAPAFFEPLRELAAAWHDRAAGAAAQDALAQQSRAPATTAAASSARPSTGGLSTGGPAASAGSASTASTVGTSAPAVALSAVQLTWPTTARAAIDIANLDVAAGERVAIAGDSGSGKSTLLAVIAGLAPPDRGIVTVGDTAIDSATVAAVQRRIGWLSSRPWLRAGSLRDNVTLGRPLSSVEVDQALAVAGLGSLAARRAVRDDVGHGGDVPLSESGDGLSGGEWVRIALARAVIDPSRDLLLADEPTAHLDAATAIAVTDALIAAARGRTLIVATHDPVLIERMDRTIRLCDGCIVSEGAVGRRAA